MAAHPPFRRADLDRLHACVDKIDLSPEDRAAWNALYAFGCERVASREMAEAAGLVYGAATTSSDPSDLTSAFGRAFSNGPRANLGGMPRG